MAYNAKQHLDDDDQLYFILFVNCIYLFQILISIDFVQKVFVAQPNSLCRPVSRPFQNWTYIPNSANMLLICIKGWIFFPNSWFSTPNGQLEKDCIEAVDKENGLSESDSEVLLPALMIKMMLVIMIRMVLMIMMIVVIWWLITNRTNAIFARGKLARKNL